MTAQEKNQEYMKLCQKRGIEPPTVQTIEDVFIFQCFLAGMDSAEIEQLLEMKLTNRQKDLIRVCRMLEIPLHFDKEQDADSLLQDIKNYIRERYAAPSSENKEEKIPEENEKKEEIPQDIKEPEYPAEESAKKQEPLGEGKEELMMKVLKSDQFNARQLEQLKTAFQKELSYEVLKSIAIPQNTAEEMRLKIEFYEIAAGKKQEEEPKNWWDKFGKK